MIREYLQKNYKDITYSEKTMKLLTEIFNLGKYEGKEEILTKIRKRKKEREEKCTKQ